MVIAVGVINLFVLRSRGESLLQAAFGSAAVAYVAVALVLARGPLPVFAAASLAAFALVALIVVPAARVEARVDGPR
jgi:hypothetical protein